MWVLAAGLLAIQGASAPPKPKPNKCREADIGSRLVRSNACRSAAEAERAQRLAQDAHERRLNQPIERMNPGQATPGDN